MLKAVINLTNSNSDLNAGNHKVRHEGNERHFIYFRTVICKADDKAKTYTVDNGGYNTQSTTRAINDYKRYFDSKGYKLA